MLAAALSEFLSSSSSDDEVEAEVINKYINKEPIPKVKGFIETVIKEYNDTQFKQNLRINRDTFRKLCQIFEGSEFCPRHDHGGTPHKAEVYLYVFIWYAVNKTTMREVSTLFNIAKNTCSCIIQKVARFILTIIGPQSVQFPETVPEKIQLSDQFIQINGFPGVIGCIDGTYIPIRTPAHKLKSTYVNRHDQTAITLQAICDPNKKFIDIFTGPPSKIHDARIFKMSFIYSKILNIGREYHILGDSAYPISENVLTPYKDYGTLTGSERNFNKKHSQVRVKIENAFGLLKSRFRQLIHVDLVDVKKISTFILACCVLHNMCIDNTDDIELIQDVENDNDDELPIENRRDGLLKRLGEMKRNEIKVLLEG